jgi:hypothetical protein
LGCPSGLISRIHSEAGLGIFWHTVGIRGGV